MPNDRQKKAYVVLAAVGVLVLATTVCYVALKAPRESLADGSHLRDLPGRIDTVSTPQAPRRVVPQASIPWKRGSDKFAAVMVVAAQVPWARNVNRPGATVLWPAGLPWIRRETARTPVDLETGALP